MRDHILIFFNGRRREVRGRDVFLSVADFLREKLQLTGTKIVCAEGDCGSCTVLLGSPTHDSIEYRPVCSCIQFVYQLDGVHVVTVEGLKYEGALNPIQESMVACHGAQCGFCTPGFVVAMQGLYESCGSREPAEEEVRTSLTGNLCRCTGYFSILQSAAKVSRDSVRSVNDLYPPGDIAPELVTARESAVLIEGGERTFFKPTTLADAATFKAAHLDVTIISGGTDIGVQVNKGLRDPHVILSTGGIEGLRSIAVEAAAIVAGAGASFTDLERVARDVLPEYARLLYWFGSPLIRNAGTIGGNIANGSPIGDSMPALFVLDAEIELTGVNGARRVNINSFYTGYRKTVMAPDELISRVFIPLPATNETLKLYKISRRKDLDISAFTAAFWVRSDGKRIVDARVAFGGVGPVIFRASRTEEALRGASFTRETFERAGEIAREEVTPIDDVRGSADYRRQLTQNILIKLFHDLKDNSDYGDHANGHPNGDGAALRERRV